jgi:hypothetical protein
VKKAQIITLVVVNFFGFCFFGLIGSVVIRGLIHGTPGTLIWLPFLIAALITLTTGILTLKRKSWRWGIAGLSIVVLVGSYFGFLFYELSHAW